MSWWLEYGGPFGEPPLPEGEERDTEPSRHRGDVPKLEDPGDYSYTGDLRVVNVDDLRAPVPPDQSGPPRLREEGHYPNHYNLPLGIDQWTTATPALPKVDVATLARSTTLAPPVALARALEDQGVVGNAIKGFFGGIGKSVGGFLDKKFGTSKEWADAQNYTQERLAAGDRTGMYAPFNEKVGFNPMVRWPATILNKMGFAVQDMTPYGFAVMERDEAERLASNPGPQYAVESPGDDVSVQAGTQVAGVGSGAARAPGAAGTLGAGGPFRSARFSGYPDFTKPNPFG